MATREQTPKALAGGLGDVATTHPWSYAASLLLVAVAYYAAAKLGLRLALVGRNITPFWSPTGIAVVAFILVGRSVWPGVALAAFAVNLPISTNGLAAAATAAGKTLAPVVAATLLSKIGFHRQIDRLRDATAIVFVAALLSMASAPRLEPGPSCWGGRPGGSSNGGGAGRPARRAHRLMGGRQGRRAVPGRNVLEKMLLQAFNATVAFCSFFFAALATERMQAHQALERAESSWTRGCGSGRPSSTQPTCI